MDAPRILFQRSGVVAIVKPAGLATQAPPGIASVESWLRDQLHAGSPRGYLGVPHRLDRAVSGVLLMASTPRAARQLSRQFERRQVSKTYLAVVSAAAAPPAELDALLRAGSTGVTWEDLLVKIPDAACTRLADATTPGARAAVTRAVMLGPSGHDSAAWSSSWLVQLEPVTGRMHQLRIQASVRGLPILGDVLYGGPSGWCPETPTLREEPIALHAWQIRYRDPDSAEELMAEAELPDVWPAAVRTRIDRGGKPPGELPATAT